MTFFSQKIDNFQNFWRKKYAFFQQNLSIRVKVKYWSLEVGDLLSVLFLWLHLIAAWKLCPKNFWRKKKSDFLFPNAILSKIRFFDDYAFWWNFYSKNRQFFVLCRTNFCFFSILLLRKTTYTNYLKTENFRPWNFNANYLGMTFGQTKI